MQLLEEKALGVAGIGSLAFGGATQTALLVGSHECSVHLLDLGPDGRISVVSSRLRLQWSHLIQIGLQLMSVTCTCWTWGLMRPKGKPLELCRS